jgi:hypothetical protein
MRPIRCRTEKRNPSGGQNGQRVHRRLLIRGGRTKRFCREEGKLVGNIERGTNIHIGVEIGSRKKPKEREIGKKGKTKAETNNRGTHRNMKNGKK